MQTIDIWPLLDFWQESNSNQGGQGSSVSSFKLDMAELGSWKKINHLSETSHALKWSQELPWLIKINRNLGFDYKIKSD